MKNVRLALFVFWITCSTALGRCAAELREWSDSTGRFKLTASLVEVKDGVVFLKNANGKLISVPLSRLSEHDKSYVAQNDNPFVELAPNSSESPFHAESNSEVASDPSAKDDSQQVRPKTKLWNHKVQIDWKRSVELNRKAPPSWRFNVEPFDPFPFEPKRATLPAKRNFFEHLRRLEVNVAAKRAVVGFTVNNLVPQPLSRLSLIDLQTGKAIHTDSIEADMSPLCLLPDGRTVVMVGSGREVDTADRIQLWTIEKNNVERSETWIPFFEQGEWIGKKTNYEVAGAYPVGDRRLVLFCKEGFAVCIEPFSRKVFWHSRFLNAAMAPSPDGKWLAVLEEQSIMIIDPVAGAIVAKTSLADKAQLSRPNLCWNNNGTKLLVNIEEGLRVLDLKSGQWKESVRLGKLGTQSLGFPNDTFALSNESALIHLESQIKVCHYSGASRLHTVGRYSFVGIQEEGGGAVLPVQLPHADAEKALAQAEKDDSVFLIRSGVVVSIKVDEVGQYGAEVSGFLQKAALAAGYRVVPDSPITIEAMITGPIRKAVSYYGGGSGIADHYGSMLKIRWQNIDVWSSSGTNIPSMMSIPRGTSLQQALDAYGKKPNLEIFEEADFPKLLQKPRVVRENQVGTGNGGDCLLQYAFTPQTIPK